MELIHFFVPGKPACAGSKKAFINPRTHKIVVAHDDERTMPWRTNVQGHALLAMRDCKRIDSGPIQLAIVFLLERPKSHFGTGGNANKLKESAPRFVVTKPDLTKIVRAIEDALTGICWTDDNQVVHHNTVKKYVSDMGIPGAEITISRMT